MLVIPAIDIRGGKCVRLDQGDAARETVYDADPVAVARRFAEAGAELLHVVDLDGAFEGRRMNAPVIQALREAVDIGIELGGGMRSVADMEAMLALGIDSVIVGTLAVKTPSVLEEALGRYGGARIQLGIDARDGQVAVGGWTETTALDAAAFASQWKGKGIERVIFTDISRDGMLQGPNLDAIRGFAEASGVRVTASGGVSNRADVDALATLLPIGVDRVVVGKALYEGTLTLDELF